LDENYRSATLSNSNLALTGMGLNPSLRSERVLTIRLNRGATLNDENDNERQSKINLLAPE
jgi:hypothetical protein